MKKLCGLLPAFLVLAQPLAAQQLIWSEEFDSGTQPSPTIWSYDLGAGGWGNAELQEYTDRSENVRVENGTLIITAIEQSGRGPNKTYTSGRIKTEDKLTFQYGTIEARIQLPDLADGLWPAFWTLGNNFSSVGWPACGELDVMEMGSAEAIANGTVNRTVTSAAHWQHNGNYAGYGLSYTAPYTIGGSGQFHIFRMDWTPELIQTYVDGALIWAIDISASNCTDCAEFHQPHFMLLNLAVGGSYTGITRSANMTAPMPAQMAVDWIRLYDNGHTILGGSSIGGGGGNGGGNGGGDPVDATIIFVADINASSVNNGGGRRSPSVEVLIMDDSGALVVGASVTGAFSGDVSGSYTATTNNYGVAIFSTSDSIRQLSYTFCVTNVSGTLPYESAANTQTCASN